MIEAIKLFSVQMVLSGKPWCLSDNVMPLHPVRFWETWVDVLHHFKDDGTRSLGFSPIKGTFPVGHIIFIVLQDGTQVNPHSL